MPSDRLISSIRNGDKIELFNKANAKDNVAATAERKAIRFTRSEGQFKNLSVEYIQGARILSERLFEVDSSGNLLNLNLIHSNDRCSLILETSKNLTRYQMMANTEDLSLSLEIKKVTFAEKATNAAHTKVELDIVDVAVAAGTITKIVCTITQPIEAVKKQATVSKLKAIFGQHAKFLKQD